MISIIVATSENNVIGHLNKIPWYVPRDLKHFAAITRGHTVIMGRNTYFSMGKALPKRKNIVLSSASDFTLPDALVYDSLPRALSECRALIDIGEHEEVFIIGGEKVFTAALPFANRMYLTMIDEAFTMDTYFPQWARDEWEHEIHVVPADEKNLHAMRFMNMTRKTT